MSPESRLRVVPAEPLDEESRRLVPRANGAALDDRTARERDLELPSTEPDGNEQLARVRDSVISGLLLLEDQRQKTPRDVRVPEPVAAILAAEPPTKPSRPEPSDVFAPAGARERVLDPEGATPRDRPPRHIARDRPTDLDVHRAVTRTMKGRPYAPLSERTEPLPRHARETDQERALVASIYDSERAFTAIAQADPERAKDIVGLVETLKGTGRLADREIVLAAHARDKIALRKADVSLREGHEDRVLALALIGRELDDRFREQMKIEQERLLDEIEVLPDDKRSTVYADFESFAENDAADDSNFCRREMHRALREEREELHRAYVFALALERKRARAEENVPTLIVEDDSSSARGRG